MPVIRRHFLFHLRLGLDIENFNRIKARHKNILTEKYYGFKCTAYKQLSALPKKIRSPEITGEETIGPSV